jgi:hypothetical protein
LKNLEKPKNFRILINLEQETRNIFSKNHSISSKDCSIYEIREERPMHTVYNMKLRGKKNGRIGKSSFTDSRKPEKTLSRDGDGVPN